MRFFNDQYNKRREAAGLSFEDIANLVGVKKSMAYAGQHADSRRGLYTEKPVSLETGSV